MATNGLAREMVKYGTEMPDALAVNMAQHFLDFTQAVNVSEYMRTLKS